MFGIPNMKLDKSVIKRRRKLMEDEGVLFHTGVNIGITSEDKTSDKKGSTGLEWTSQKLLEDYDAVVLCCGAKKARPLAAADPEKVKGVYFAVDFLTQTTKALIKASESGVENSSDHQHSDVEKDRVSVEKLKSQVGYIDAAGKNVVIVGGGDTGNVSEQS